MVPGGAQNRCLRSLFPRSTGVGMGWGGGKGCVCGGNLVGDGAFGPKSSGTWDNVMGSFLSLQEQQWALG